MKDSEEVEVAVEQDVRVVQGKRGFINIRRSHHVSHKCSRNFALEAIHSKVGNDGKRLLSFETICHRLGLVRSGHSDVPSESYLLLLPLSGPNVEAVVTKQSFITLVLYMDQGFAQPQVSIKHHSALFYFYKGRLACF